MFPDGLLKGRLAYMNARLPGGQLHARDHLHRRPLAMNSSDEIAGCVNSGGAGCFAQLADYSRKFNYRQRDLC